MALKYGPFNGLENAWDAYDWARYFKSLIGNGVFPNPSTGLQVIAHENMQTKIKVGFGFIEGHYIENDSDLILSHAIADGVLKRIDRVVMRVNFLTNKAELLIKKGVTSSSPIAPVLVRNTDYYELALADVSIANGVTEITQANITDQRLNTELCGIVHGVVDQIDTTTLALQYQDAFNQMTTDQQQDFMDWFADLQVTLDGNVAATLTNRLITVEDRVEDVEVNINNINQELVQITSQVTDTPIPNKLLKLDNTAMLNFLALPTLSKNIFVRRTDGNGVGIFSPVYDTSVNLILIAYRKSDATQYLFATGYRANHTSVAGLNVVASNGLSLGSYNSSGTQVINGAPSSDVLVTAVILGGGQPS